MRLLEKTRKDKFVKDIKILLSESDITEYELPKQMGWNAIVLVSILCLIFIYEGYKDPDIFVNNYLVTLFVLSIMIGIIALGINIIRTKNIVIKLDLKGITYEKRFIKWDRVKEMYTDWHYDGDVYNHYICVVTKSNETIEVSIDNLGKTKESIITEFGKYYWNWKRINV